MMRNIAIIFLVSLFSTAACVKSQVEANSTNVSVSKAESGRSESQSFDENNKKISIVNNPNGKIFRGMINGVSFEMNLVRDGSKLSGTYFYAKVRKNLKLSGTINENGEFVMQETDEGSKPTGDWKGTWKEEKNVNGAVLEGYWKKPTESENNAIPFYATQQIIEFTNGVKFVDKTLNEFIKAKRADNFINYPQLTGINSPSEKKFNELFKNAAERSNTDYQKFLGELTDEDIKDLPEAMKLDHQFDYDVVFADNNFVSLTSSNYVFEGGAHGSTSISSINYDLKNNKQLELADNFKPNSDYLKVISDYAIEDLKVRLGEMRDDEWISGGASAKTDNFETWNLTKKGLMITFGQYQVAPYAAGLQTVIIPYDKLKDILQEDSIAAKFAKAV